jgi:tRNA 2-selenouridine synthase
MIQPIETHEFLTLSKSFPVIDVRSPLEFMQGHIPGAHNLPLFDDDERKKIGTLYKQAGREAAILDGLGFAGNKLQNYVKQARKIAQGRKVLLHCWRGGMRSESMAWLLSLSGFEVNLLKGGYKAYRNYIRVAWNKKCDLRVLSGKTGTGKTEILDELAKLGHQVVDLEKSAHHKGSTFGAIGETPQPSNEQFENNLASLWMALDFSKPVWIEDESRFIGTVNIPEPLYQRMQESKTIRLEIPKNLRIQRLVKDYAGYSKELLVCSLLRIGKRLGGQHVKNAIEAIHNDDFETAIDIVLTYYDKTYTFDLSKKNSDNIILLESNTENAEMNAQLILKSLFENAILKN